jgi:signal transduction histidine kinase
MPAPPHAPLLQRIRPIHWIWLDVLTGAGYGVLALVVLVNQATSMVDAAAAFVGATCLGLPLALRRAVPVASLTTLLAAMGVLALVAPPGVVMVLPPLVLVLYTVATTCELTLALVALLVSCVCVILTGLPDLLHPGGIVVAIPAFVASWALGLSFGVQRRHLHTQVQLQEQARRVESQQALMALSEQRVQIARELHDVVAHGVSVITVQAGFAGLVLDDGDQVASALRSIETTGRQTLAEMRSLLDVLRQPGDDVDDEALAPAPSLRDLDALADRTRDAGVDVTVTSRGSVRPLSPLLELTAFRIVQEALTNVVKHAGRAHAAVDLLYATDQLVVTVCDDGEATEEGVVLAGHGIIGMIERASAVGGTLRAGPLPGHGYSVKGVLPVLPARPLTAVHGSVHA